MYIDVVYEVAARSVKTGGRVFMVLFLLLGYAPATQGQDWRVEAEARIEAHRMADFIFDIKDANGTPIEGATVQVEMQRHAFKFGTAVQAAWVRDEPRALLASGDLDLGEKLSAFRVPLDAPQGAVIASAHLQFTADKDNQEQATALTIWASVEGDAPDFDLAGISSRPRTAASVAWTVPPWMMQEESGPAQRSPDVTSLVQEVVDQAGWQAGQHIVFILDGSGKRSARTFDKDPQVAPQLVLTVAGEEKNARVSRLIDDAEETGSDFFGDDANRYRSELVQLFNYAAPGNALKWRPWEGDPAVAEGTLAWLASRNIPVRGHAMIWSSWRWDAIPVDVEERQNEPEFVRRRAADHVKTIAETYAGRVPEWDVVNEPLHETDLEDIIGFDERLNWFQLARAGAPNARLFVNDFDILEGPAKVQAYKTLITDLINAGAAIDGVGMQGHFLGQPPTAEQLVTRLASLAELGLPLQITEFDMNNSWSSEQQAAFMEEVLVASFAEPAMTAFNMWGFWDGNHWLGNAPLFAGDWTLKQSGAVWKDYVFNRWWTDEEVITDATGTAELRAFKGDYKLTIHYKGHTDSLEVSLPFQQTIDWTLPGVSVANESDQAVETGLKSSIYPNPASGIAHFVVDISAVSEVQLELFDVLGRQVWQHTSASLAPGTHRFMIPDQAGLMANGLYMARVTAVSSGETFVNTLPLMYMR